MMKINKRLPSVLCIILLIMGECVPVYAENVDKAETASKTINISVDEDDEDADDTDGEKELEEEEEKEDGNSQRTYDPSIARPDITEMTEVRIGNYEEWCDFARKCTLDTWSADKYVVLTDNIDFNMKEFVPVPLFCGVFDGQGHTINRAAYTKEQNYIGIFSKTSPAAVIRNLNVIGIMKPAGKPFDIGGIVGDNAGMIAQCKYDGYVEGYDYIGGIVGYNEATGIISACSVTGKITGLHHVGGVCGTNAGLVTGCSTKADINTVTKEMQTGLSDIKVEELFTSLLNMGREDGNKKSISATSNPVDIGGIVGSNTGEISSCANDSTVGYEHVGYNVGGIVGRSSGYVHDCINNGSLNGRKDIGGIIGQAEPYIRLDLTKDIIAQLSENINGLHDAVEKTISDTDNSSGVVSARLNVIKNFADMALSDTGYLANSTEDFVNGAMNSTNQIMGRIEYVLDETSKNGGPMDDLTDAGSDLRGAASDLEKAAEDLDIYNYMSEDEKTEYDAAKTNLKNATEEYSGYYSEKYDEVYDGYYRKQYYKELTGLDYPGTNPPTDEELAAAGDGKTPEEIDEAKAKAASEAARKANSAATTEANDKYTTNHPGSSYATDVEGYADTISRIVLKYSDQMTQNAKSDGKAATKDIKSMAGNLKDAGSQMKSIVRDVAGRGAVQFPQLSDEYRLRTNSLVSNIQGMSDNLGYLNNEMKGSTDTVCNDLEDVNDKFSTIMLLFTDAMDGVLDMDYSTVYEDESNDVCETSIDATVADCSNFGSVRGDINTGGIAGTMAEEYDFDLEGDVTGVKDSSVNSTYRTKCVLRNNRNMADVRGKKSYVGGVCGLHEIGTILRCSDFSKVSSESGDYVGGIAGRSYATIRQSYEKGILSGQSYIGGICGNGADITDCVAMPNIMEGTNFTGAVAGYVDEGAKIKRNVFVSSTLAGLDRISRTGVAEPVEYRDLLAMDGIPGEYSLLRVDYIVDDIVVSSADNRVGEEIYPEEVPLDEVIIRNPDDDNTYEDKVVLDDDQYIEWDFDEAKVIYEDTEINGEIVRYASSLASEQVRNNKQSVFLVDGVFRKNDELTVTVIGDGADGQEEYVLTIPDDGAMSHRIRYQMPDGVENVMVLLGNGGNYEETECETYGKYITFSAPGNEVVVRVIEEEKGDAKRLWIPIGVGACIAVTSGVIATIAIRKKKSKNPSKSRKSKQEKPKKEKP
ncbi:MAG: hypothetical protein IJ245_07320 [Lachnospiraceae bacterium]|nr:hypothetical protein [Lachnospiraceae bacterium]